MSRIVRVGEEKIRVDNDVPMPLKKARRRHPWHLLKVGESFLFPKDAREQSARVAAHMASNRTGFKFSVRRTEVGLRCWRVE